MSSRRTRDRQLAKLAARRAAQRRRRRRQRIIAGVVAVALAAGGGTGLYLAFTGGAGQTNARASSTPSSPANVKHGTGKQTGTVKPKPPPASVACGATAPPTAGKPKPQFDGRPPLKIDKSATYVATMKTSCGVIRIQLLSKEAPETVNSFVFLAQHDFFNGQYLHRIADSIDVIQGGDPTGSGSGGPRYTTPDEVPSNPSYGPGTLAMANTGQPNSGGSQFFLITGPKGHGLDSCNQPGQTCYTIFGHVIAGLDVAQRIQGLPVKGFKPNDPNPDGPPQQAVYIDKVTVVKKG